jgi:hypothetical protein
MMNSTQGGVFYFDQYGISSYKTEQKQVGEKDP